MYTSLTTSKKAETCLIFLWVSYDNINLFDIYYIFLINVYENIFSHTEPQHSYLSMVYIKYSTQVTILNEIIFPNGLLFNVL